MEITITAGWWLIPATITLIAWAWFFFQVRKYSLEGGLGNAVTAIAYLLFLCCATMATLTAWLCYFIIF